MRLASGSSIRGPRRAEGGSGMFSVGVREHIMIAHSFKGEVFGPAQALHGATFIVDCEFRRPTLADGSNIVVDIGRAGDALKAILAELNYQNLDALPMFEGQNTTTEFLARHVHERMAQAIREGRLGPGSDGVAALKV